MKEAEERARRDAEERAKQEAQRLEQVEKERRRHEREQRENRMRSKWLNVRWTNGLAVQRYIELCKVFDSTNFHEDNRVVFDLLPWPVLVHPLDLCDDVITWDAIEKFYEAAYCHTSYEEFKALIQDAQKRFHPDRWSSRGVLRGLDDEERQRFIKLTTTVSQSVSPLWREARGGTFYLRVPRQYQYRR